MHQALRGIQYVLKEARKAEKNRDLASLRDDTNPSTSDPRKLKTKFRPRKAQSKNDTYLVMTFEREIGRCWAELPNLKSSLRRRMKSFASSKTIKIMIFPLHNTLQSSVAEIKDRYLVINVYEYKNSIINIYIHICIYTQYIYIYIYISIYIYILS